MNESCIKGVHVALSISATTKKNFHILCQVILPSSISVDLLLFRHHTNCGGLMNQSVQIFNILPNPTPKVTHRHLPGGWGIWTLPGCCGKFEPCLGGVGRLEPEPSCGIHTFYILIWRCIKEIKAFNFTSTGLRGKCLQKSWQSNPALG